MTFKTIVVSSFENFGEETSLFVNLKVYRHSYALYTTDTQYVSFMFAH